MMPYQIYQLYQVERPKSTAEIRSADERAGRAAAAVAGMLRQLSPAARHRRAPQHRAMECPLAVSVCCGRMTGTMEV
jgi:hypothetical protein